MKCAFDYCIYNKELLCILDEIEINSFGMCEACIIVSIPEKELQLLKEKELEKYP